MRKCTKTLVQTTNLFQTALNLTGTHIAYLVLSHLDFQKPYSPPFFLNTGIDSTRRLRSPICWHPSIHLITQSGMKRTIQEKMGFRQYEVTKALEHISCVCSRTSSCTLPPYLHLTRGKCNRCPNVVTGAVQTCRTQGTLTHA